MQAVATTRLTGIEVIAATIHVKRRIGYSIGVGANGRAYEVWIFSVLVERRVAQNYIAAPFTRGYPNRAYGSACADNFNLDTTGSCDRSSVLIAYVL